jgi:CHAT domain-containing protein/tetratricopeptide (TPR) repeat protein
MDKRTVTGCRRYTPLLAALVLTSCSSASQETAYERVWSLYTSGALPEAAQAAAIQKNKFRRSGDLALFWKFRLLEAEALLAQVKVSEASALLKEEIPASLRLTQLEFRQRMDLADACSKSRQAHEAIAILDRARPQVSDPDLQNRIDVLKGSVLGRIGRIDEAEQLLNRAVVETNKLGDAYQESSALINLSSCKKSRYRYSEAVEIVLRAVDIADRHGYRRVAGAAHGILGSLYRIIGDFERASAHQQKAVELFSAIGDHGSLLIALGELGLFHENQDEFDKAIQAYERAYNLAKSLNQNPDAARNAVNLSEAYIEMHLWDKAEEWNEKSRQLAGAASASGPYQIVNGARIADGRGQTRAAIEMFKQAIMTPGVPPTLMWDCHAYLARIYVRQHQSADADKEYRALLDVIDKARSELLKSQDQITFLSHLIHFHEEYVDLLMDRKDDSGALRIIESSRARVLADQMGLPAVLPHTTSSVQLMQLAKETKTSIISFWLAPKRSFAWLIDKSGVQRFDLPSEGEIEPLVTAYRNVVEHALKDPIASGDPNGPKLWNLLLRDIAPKIPKNGRVLVIPDGPLHRLNIETLPVPSPQPHYWIEDVEVAVAPSLAIAASKPERNVARNASLLLIGAPDYKGTEYRPLEKAGTEISGIEARFPNAKKVVHIASDATPEVYRNSKPDQFSLIHFAAHAEASNESPLESAVVLSHHGDSYKLYARDVIDVPIHADLVTISGCKSAGVRAYEGEGLIGFAWAFLQAGAHGVVAGLWDVSDTSTEPLMNEFYGGIASGVDAVTAMRQAKLALLKQAAYSKPFYWAPFQVYVRSARK